MSTPMSRPNVPQGYEGYVGSDMVQNFESWQRINREGLRQRIGEIDLETVDIGGQRVRAVILDPVGPEHDGKTFVEPFPHPQGWTEAMAVRALVHVRTVAPNSTWIFLPHGRDFYRPTTEQRERMFNGDDRVLPELQVRLLEKLNEENKLGDIAAVGESLGGNLATGIAAVNQDLHITEVIATETVSGDRGRGFRGLLNLLGDLGKSTSKSQQLQAIADAGIPVLRDEIFTPKQLTQDWNRAGLSYLSPTNVAIQLTMLGAKNDLIEQALRNNPDMFMVQNRVRGSHIHRPIGVGDDSRLMNNVIESPHAHMLMDNPYAGAVMILHGLALAADHRSQKTS